MPYNAPACPHCNETEFATCQNGYGNDIFGPTDTLVICWKCYKLMVAKPVRASNKETEK